MIVFVYGTRPEALKVGPVVAELAKLNVPHQVIATGQHWNLLKGTPAETDLKDAISLGVPSRGDDPRRWIAQTSEPLQNALDSLKPDVVVVQGDTASALAGALSAYQLDMPVAHIEAGVRSHNLEEPWPEEGFRREITGYAHWHYAPTSTAYANLLAEGVPTQDIRLTGNTVVSALHRYAGHCFPGGYPAFPDMDHVVLTMHRREWLNTVDLPVFLGELADWCLEHPSHDLMWPVHPAVEAKWPKEWTQPPNLKVWPPLQYRAMVDLLGSAIGLATDSGGLVEEAATLGIPTAILRNSNDRPEAVEAGIAKQFAPSDLRGALTMLVNQELERKPTNAFGDYTAAPQIANHLANLT